MTRHLAIVGPTASGKSAVALAVAPIILYGSVYLTDAAGPGSRLWTPLEMAGILAAFGAAIALQWFLLVKLQRKTAGRSVPFAMSIVCAAAALTIMFSGYLTGGQLGLPFAAALGTAVVASLLLSGPPASEGGVGVALVALASLLIMGRFFGSLTTFHAVLLFAVPCLAWIPEIPPLASLRPRIRGAVRLALVAAAVGVVVWQAHEKFKENALTTNEAYDYGQ